VEIPIAFDLTINIPSIVAAVSVIVALFLGIRQLRHIVNNRQAQLFMQLYDRYSSEEFLNDFTTIIGLQWTDFDDYWEKYGLENNKDIALKIHSTGSYFEGVGVLVKRGLISVEMVDDLMSGSIIRYWEKMCPMIIEQREMFNWPEALEWTEYLYDQIMKKKNKNK
jgi:hypothetical protein